MSTASNGSSAGSLTKRQAAKLATQQKLLAAVRALMAEGKPLSIADAAKRAGIGTATAYRYYSDLDTLRSDAALDLRMDEGKPDFLSEYADRVAGVDDPEERLVIAQRQMLGFTADNDLDYRMFVAKSQEQHIREAAAGRTAQPKTGRRIVMIDAALQDLQKRLSDADWHDLLHALLLVTGPDPWMILRDVAGLEREACFEVNERALRDLFRAHMKRLGLPHRSD